MKITKSKLKYDKLRRYKQNERLGLVRRMTALKYFSTSEWHETLAVRTSTVVSVKTLFKTVYFLQVSTILINNHYVTKDNSHDRNSLTPKLELKATE